MKHPPCNRRSFLRWGVTFAAGAPLAWRHGAGALLAAEAPAPPVLSPSARAAARVAIAECRGYAAAEVRAAFTRCFDLLGGIGPLVNGKTVTVKLNLTGTNFLPFLNRPVGETYMTHFTTAAVLASQLFAAGARRVRFVESTQSRAALDATLALADWDVNALNALGRVEYENTRNLGSGKSYARLPVPGGGLMFSAFDLNRAYADTDVMVSLCKLKQHITAGVTLSLKNLFGITPNSLYGDEAGTEDATAGRGPIHNPLGHEKIKLPGLKDGITSRDPTWRVPRTIADLCAARPIHLALIDGITAMSGGEGPWCRDANPLKLTTPGVLIAGLDPVATDAVGTAVMGYANPRAGRGQRPFHFCDNHLLLAEQAGLGTADLAQMDVRGLSLEKARHPYPDARGA
jgi:uncharacterized protein (DUF362 family)